MYTSLLLPTLLASIALAAPNMPRNHNAQVIPAKRDVTYSSAGYGAVLDTAATTTITVFTTVTAAASTSTTSLIPSSSSSSSSTPIPTPTETPTPAPTEQLAGVRFPFIHPHALPCTTPRALLKATRKLSKTNQITIGIHLPRHPLGRLLRAPPHAPRQRRHLLHTTQRHRVVDWPGCRV